MLTFRCKKYMKHTFCSSYCKIDEMAFNKGGGCVYIYCYIFLFLVLLSLKCLDVLVCNAFITQRCSTMGYR